MSHSPSFEKSTATSGGGAGGPDDIGTQPCASESGITEFHQPIGFVCCCCKYRSSGRFCSNPVNNGCRHKRVPRCRSCPIIFTSRS
ncbi:hypothetical protein GGR50DRAFT_667235, partial [Xylaria sp. CBS 124048]